MRVTTCQMRSRRDRERSVKQLAILVIWVTSSISETLDTVRRRRKELGRPERERRLGRSKAK